MSRATPRMRDLSERLIALETTGDRSCTSTIRVCEKLRPHLATLMGSAGFQALFSRAVAVAKPEVGWLRWVQVKADGSLEGVDELEAQVSPEEMTEGCVVLLAQLLGLLVAFIGEDLTFRVVRELWPKLSFDNLDSGK
jgi:hypothetical protein